MLEKSAYDNTFKDMINYFNFMELCLLCAKIV